MGYWEQIGQAAKEREHWSERRRFLSGLGNWLALLVPSVVIFLVAWTAAKYW